MNERRLKYALYRGGIMTASLFALVFLLPILGFELLDWRLLIAVVLLVGAVHTCFVYVDFP